MIAPYQSVRHTDNRLGGRQPVQSGRTHVSRVIFSAALVLFAFLIVAGSANAALPRSFYQLAVIIVDREAPQVDFSFWLDSPYSSTNNQTMAKTIDITANFGPELTCDSSGCQTSSDYVGHLDNARGDQWFNVTTHMAPSPTTPVFTTVNVHVVYTDADGAQARTIDRSLTFAVHYAAPPPSVNIAAAAAVGLGGAGVLGIGLYAMRRARLEELYLMHDSGMLIRHWSRKQGIVHDSDIMSGMLIILQEFVRDSFDDRRGTLEQLRFGQRQVIMVRGEHTVLAAVIEGRYVNGLPRKLQLSVWEFEKSHADTLAKWDGNVALLPQADAIAQRFIRPRLRLHPS